MWLIEGFVEALISRKQRSGVKTFGFKNPTLESDANTFGQEFRANVRVGGGPETLEKQG